MKTNGNISEYLFNKSDVQQFFEEKGFKVDWDFSRKLGETWYEIFNKETGKMILQIDSSVTLKQLKEEFLNGPDDGDPPFFIASELPDKEWNDLINKLKQ